MSVSSRPLRQVTLHAPGRINLIGEHTDYNSGLVLPAAIQHGLTFHLTRANNRCCQVKSEKLGLFSFELDRLPGTADGWRKYILGVVSEIQRRTTGLGGFNCEISSNLPGGSGLSSSAALTCGLASGLDALFELQLNSWEVIDIAREAEHQFAGTRCGIMDPFASVMGRQGHFILLDCQSHKFEYLPADLGAYELVLFQSGVTHRLGESAYNLRRETCEKAVAIMQQHFQDITTLRDVSLEQLNAAADLLTPKAQEICRFVLEENQRVRQTVKALKEKSLSAVGQLLFDSHRGLRDQYRVSCPELDFLVARAMEHPDILGARMMGGGFGGCSINLVREGKSEAVFQDIAVKYREAFSLNLEIIKVQPGDGVRVLPG